MTDLDIYDENLHIETFHPQAWPNGPTLTGTDQRILKERGPHISGKAKMNYQKLLLHLELKGGSQDPLDPIHPPLYLPLIQQCATDF